MHNTYVVMFGNLSCLVSNSIDYRRDDEIANRPLNV
jgi:hypothetical protein